MRKLLFALVALTAVSSFAADKGTEFKFGGEIRTRYSNWMNSALAGDNGPTIRKANNQWWAQRNSFHVTALNGDKFQGFLEFANNFQWGNAAAGSQGYAEGNTPNATSGGATGSVVQAQEAWMWWKITDSFSGKFGRQEFSLADGNLFSANSWGQSPTAFDGATFTYGFDFLDLGLFALKLQDVQAASATAANTNDDEVNVYGLNLGFKTLPDVLKGLDIYLAQINGDQVGATWSASAQFPGLNSATMNQWNLMTYGARLKGEFAMLDFALEGDFQSGKGKSSTGGSDTNFKGSSYQVELGANFAEFMKARLFGKYFVATGDDGTTAQDYEGFMPLFWNRHCTHGCADLVNQTNLQDITLGFSLKPQDETTVGLKYVMLSRQTDKGAASFLNPGTFGPAAGTRTAGTNTDKPILNEIDLWASHAYGNGFTALAEISFLSPGDYLKGDTNNQSPASGTRFVVQGNYAF